MPFNLVTFRNRATRAKKPGGGSEFWKKFWEDDINDENRNRYQSSYTRRKSSITRTSRTIASVIKTNTAAKLYAEVKLDARSTAKTTSPNEIWTETGLEIVAGKDNSTFVISGTAEEFGRLESLATQSTFEAAYLGTGVARKKDKMLARELFAVSALRNNNATVEGRTSVFIENILEGQTTGRIESIIELYSNQPHADYTTNLNLFTNRFPDAHIERRDERLFYNNMSYKGILSPHEIRTILESEDFNFVSRIREMNYLISQRCIPRVDLNTIQFLEPLTDEIVGLVDSGIHHPSLVRFRSHHMNYLEAHQTADENHGTFVASRILFGSDIFEPAEAGTSLQPSSRILDVQVLYTDGTGSRVNPEKLKEAILEMVNRHTDVAIYNLSIAEDNPVKEGDISELTEFLDYIAREKDITFVCSVGNQQVYLSHSYNQTFKQRESWISAPGDGLNVIAVGSSSKNCSPDTLCTTEDYPSPFTRVGGLNKEFKRPQLVENGGNIRRALTGVYDAAHLEASTNQFGVEGINRNGLSRDIGTSQSTPLITRECVLLLNYLKKTSFATGNNLVGNRANLLKALLIHSTTRRNQVSPSEETQKHALGFGIPSHSLVLTDNENQLSLVYADGINLVEKKHKIRINLPEYLLGQPVEMIFTLVYNPPVDKNYPAQYKMIDLDATLRIVSPEFDENGGVSDKEKFNRQNPSPSWENYQHNSDSVIHFKKSIRRLSSQVLEILLQLSPTRVYENKIVGREEDEIQNYALILTLVDQGGTNQFRQQVLALNELEEIIETEVEVEATN